MVNKNYQIKSQARNACRAVASLRHDPEKGIVFRKRSWPNKRISDESDSVKPGGTLARLRASSDDCFQNRRPRSRQGVAPQRPCRGACGKPGATKGPKC